MVCLSLALFVTHSVLFIWYCLLSKQQGVVVTQDWGYPSHTYCREQTNMNTSKNKHYVAARYCLLSKQLGIIVTKDRGLSIKHIVASKPI